jgi:hypothetical protein
MLKDKVQNSRLEYQSPLLEEYGQYALVTGSFGGDFLPGSIGDLGSDFLDQPDQE